MPSLPPPVPSYIFRGHASQINTLAFLPSSSDLITGDADGFVVIWSLTTRRPRAVWRAHKEGLLKVEGWPGEEGKGKVVTHGRDNTIHVWEVPPAPARISASLFLPATSRESSMRISEDDGRDGEAKEPPAQPLSTILPVDGLDLPRPQPWKVCTLHINALNFCQFAALPVPFPTSPSVNHDKDQPQPQLMIATPAVKDSDGIDINILPTCTRLHTNILPTLPLPSGENEKPGMVMAVALLDPTTLLAGYESGYTVVMKLTPNGTWETIYASKAHSQPVLSLGVHPSRGWFVTTAADAIIAVHPLGGDRRAPVVWDTGHSGLQALDIRDDGEIFATGGWDGKIRVWRWRPQEPSSKKTEQAKQLAVLKWHKESIYAVAFGRDGQGRNWVAAGSKDGKVSLWEVY
ncbi:Guanine nucleotide binding protein (G protein), beta polypeptide 1-like [Saitoella coloradoensis]